MGKILQTDGTDTKVAEFFYRVVVQAVILIGLEPWVLSTSMEKTVEGEHTGFLRQITGKRGQRMTGGMWVPLAAE